MTQAEIAHLRLSSQQLSDTTFQLPGDLVKWMGAVQAQDTHMVKWALGSRLPKSNITAVESDLNRASILRTHLLRPTWHYVHADDIYWMIALSAKSIQQAMRSNEHMLGLTASVYKKSFRIIEKTLRDDNHLTREELVAELNAAKIQLSSLGFLHLFMRAETEAIICSGRIINNKNTYALLEERVPVKIEKQKEEALHDLAIRYFTSHGPATLHDFSWWSGLTISNARLGLESAKSELLSISNSDNVYWFSPELKPKKSAKSKLYLLAAFDEFLVSYRNRTASLVSELNRQVITVNGLFKPVIIQDAKVIGLWKKITKKEGYEIELELFNKKDAETLKKINKEVNAFGSFHNKKTKIVLA